MLEAHLKSMSLLGRESTTSLPPSIAFRMLNPPSFLISSNSSLPSNGERSFLRLLQPDHHDSGSSNLLPRFVSFTQLTPSSYLRLLSFIGQGADSRYAQAPSHSTSEGNLLSQQETQRSVPSLRQVGKSGRLCWDVGGDQRQLRLGLDGQYTFLFILRQLEREYPFCTRARTTKSARRRCSFHDRASNPLLALGRTFDLSENDTGSRVEG